MISNDSSPCTMRIDGRVYLAEVCSALVKVDLFTDLRGSRERVHDNHVALSVLHDSVVDDEAVLKSLVLGEVLEALLLDASAVQDVRASDDLGSKLSRLGNQQASFEKLVAKVLGQGELLGGDKLDADVVEAEKVGKTVDGAAVLKVSNEGDGEVVDGSELLTNGEEVKEGLSGVLTGSVT